MAASGKNASFSFAGTVYGAADCIQSWQLNNAIAELVYQCSGFDKAAAGAQTATFTTSLALSASDTGKISALDAGSTGAFIGNPAGDTTGYIEATGSAALVTRSNLLSGARNIITYDLTMRLNDLTLQAAAT